MLLFYFIFRTILFKVQDIGWRNVQEHGKYNCRNEFEFQLKLRNQIPYRKL